MAREEFEDFAAAAAPQLYRAAYLMIGDHHLAEDLVQDVLARLYVAWPRILDTPRGYAYRALANAAANQRRWSARHPTAPLGEDSWAVGGDPADGVAVTTDVFLALRDLSPRQRVIVVLRYYVDLTETETAQALQISVGTVKSQHARALARLRVALGDDIGPPLENEPPPDPGRTPESDAALVPAPTSLLDRSTP
ncbi:MAG: SigE family RNA polymerase sigma factor [Candidatus Nanopelagicales bacterium]|jgi:RNA polymerase sigma-70 factor (sigma-E family)|nr:SigE family RNA polymerase sigma factor [Candidatus Nanopelagicales bacterium]